MIIHINIVIYMNHVLKVNTAIQISHYKHCVFPSSQQQLFHNSSSQATIYLILNSSETNEKKRNYQCHLVMVAETTK